MTDPTMVEITLQPEAEGVLRAAIQSGDIVTEALLEWQTRRSLAHVAAEIRGLWEEGLASGPGTGRDIAALKADARRNGAASTENA